MPGVGLTFDPGLVAEIIFALRARDGRWRAHCPCCSSRWTGCTLTVTAHSDVGRLQAMGGVEGAIGKHCEAVFAALPQRAQDRPGAGFPAAGGGRRGERGAHPPPRALDSVTADPDARLLVEALVEARLLQTGRDGSGAYLEIAHEALFRSWARLSDWIAGVRGDLHLLREMRRAARTWDELGRRRDYNYIW